MSVSVGANDYVLSDVIINPMTKTNVSAYIVKENATLKFSIVNDDIDLNTVVINNYYYRNFKSRNIKIKCIDTAYNADRNMTIIPQSDYLLLNAKNRLHSCLFIFTVNYKMKNAENSNFLNESFYFKIVPEEEFNMYREMLRTFDVPTTQNNEILRPKKIEYDEPQELLRPKKIED